MTHVPHLAARDDDGGPRRSLVLAGGGMRVAWQAGVLRALEEAGVGFRHGDATSGGIFNLAMLLSGLSPAEMCERWAALPARDFVALLSLPTYLRSPRWPGLASAAGIDEKVFPKLGIDVDRINAARGLDGTFNVCDFRRKQSVAIAHDAIARELLVAGVTLPAVMPAIAHGDGMWVDAVWIRDSNPLEAVRRGSDEIWLAWCIGNSSLYRNGTFRQYVHMIELAANGSLFAELDRIRELNDRIAAGEAPQGRTSPVRLHVIRPRRPIPLDPDYLLGRIDGETLVALGYHDAWRYLMAPPAGGVELSPEATRMDDGGPGVGFRVRLDGPATIAGVRGTLALRLAVEIGELDSFLADPGGDHAVLAGELRHPAFEPATMLRRGTFRFDGDRAVYSGALHSGGRAYELRASRRRRPDAPLEVSVVPAGDDATTLVMTPTRRQVAAQVGSLHARNTGNLPEGARTVLRYARALLSR